MEALQQQLGHAAPPHLAWQHAISANCWLCSLRPDLLLDSLGLRSPSPARPHCAPAAAGPEAGPAAA
ncbi:hypothetical protein HaLaN_29309 [Haematococcus lacustris]|uniref:Uncharacterized protein n=1 Tax=Haematococcus lacustris TaxID=44745 RepID=A0A6A0AC67_HAELA|nr:hypothetical protein HaLaN_29309 [Haematococcus lacustris]